MNHRGFSDGEKTFVPGRIWLLLCCLLALLVAGATRLGALYEPSQYHLTHHPRTFTFELVHDPFMFEEQRKNFISYFKSPLVEENVYAKRSFTTYRLQAEREIQQGTFLGKPWRLLSYAQRPQVILEWGNSRFPIILTTYGSLALQSVTALFPGVPQPYRGRILSVALALLYGLLIFIFLRKFASISSSEMVLAWLVVSPFFLQKFSNAYTNVTGPIVLSLAAVLVFLRAEGQEVSRQGRRWWLALGAVLVFFVVTTKITSIAAVLVAVFVAWQQLGWRHLWARHRVALLVAGGSVLLALVVMVGTSYLLLGETPFSGEGKLLTNLWRVAANPLPVLTPLVTGALIQAFYGAFLLWFLAPWALVLEVGRVALVGAGFWGAWRSWRSDGAAREDLRLPVFGAIGYFFLAGFFYYGDISFDLQLAALPLTSLLLVRGWEALGMGSFLEGSSFFQGKKFWWGMWSISLLSCGVMLLRLPFYPEYGLSLSFQKTVLQRVQDTRSQSILVVEPFTAYPFKEMAPELPLTYLEGVYNFMRNQENFSVIAPIEEFLQDEIFDLVVIPSLPVIDARKRIKFEEDWKAILTAIEAFYPHRESLLSPGGVEVLLLHRTPTTHLQHTRDTPGAHLGHTDSTHGAHP